MDSSVIKKFALETYGCQMNVADSELVEGILTNLGLEKTANYDEACLLYTSPSPRDYAASRMPSSA